MVSLVEWYQSDLIRLARTRTTEIFGPLKWRGAGRYRRAACPLHGGADANFSLNLNTLRWRCWSHCGGGDAVTFLARKGGFSGDRLRGAQWVDWLKELARICGTDLPAADERTVYRTFGIQSHRDSGTIPPAPTERIVAPEDVAGFWDMLEDPMSANESASLLTSRGLSGLADAGELCRFWPSSLKGPAWAGWEREGKHHDWRESGNALVFPMYDTNGALADLRFRNVRSTSAAWPPKSAGRSTGLVFACERAQQMLSSGMWDSSHNRQLVVCEGEMDFLSLTMACAVEGVAVIGVVSGSVTTTLASRIPRGTEVVFYSHEDAASESYLRRFLASLGPRLLTRDVRVFKF